MRIVTVLTILLIASSAANAAEKITEKDIDAVEEQPSEVAAEPAAEKPAPAPDLSKFYDSREAVSDSDDVEDVGPRFRAQPGLRECSEDEDCAVIEGICPGVPEPVNVMRRVSKEASNLKAREVGSCPESTPDPNFKTTGAVCVENECVIKKRRN